MSPFSLRRMPGRNEMDTRIGTVHLKLTLPGRQLRQLPLKSTKSGSLGKPTSLTDSPPPTGAKWQPKLDKKVRATSLTWLNNWVYRLHGEGCPLPPPP